MKLIVIFIAGFSLISCGGSSRPQLVVKTAKPVVFTTNYPLQYFAQRIGGDLSKFTFLRRRMSIRHTGNPMGQPSKPTNRLTSSLLMARRMKNGLTGLHCLHRN